MTRFFTTMASPVGELLLTSDGTALTGLSFAEPGGGPPGPGRLSWTRADAPFGEVIAQVREYFGGGRRAFDLPVAAPGTDFQKFVWAAIAAIPFGETRSYAAVAARLGKPGAARAVGLAAGRNPVLIIVPCHRVIGADGTLTGYGGGLDRKRQLLDHERTAASLDP